MAKIIISILFSAVSILWSQNTTSINGFQQGDKLIITSNVEVYNLPENVTLTSTEIDELVREGKTTARIKNSAYHQNMFPYIKDNIFEFKTVFTLNKESKTVIKHESQKMLYQETKVIETLLLIYLPMLICIIAGYRFATNKVSVSRALLLLIPAAISGVILYLSRNESLAKDGRSIVLIIIILVVVSVIICLVTLIDEWLGGLAVCIGLIPGAFIAYDLLGSPFQPATISWNYVLYLIAIAGLGLVIYALKIMQFKKPEPNCDWL